MTPKASPAWQRRHTLKTYRTRDLAIASDFDRAFDYLASPANLPDWTRAFVRVTDDGGRAILRTPEDEVDIGLETRASRKHGTIDWWMTFPDGGVGKAFSRLVDLGDGRIQYGFVLPAPPVPLERLEGTLDEQAEILATELLSLRSILEKRETARCVC